MKFVDYLDTSFHIGPSSTHNLIRSARTSLKFKWAHDKIDEFVSKLETLRGSLTLGTILALRASMTGHNEKILEHLKALQPVAEDQQGPKGTHPTNELGDRHLEPANTGSSTSEEIISRIQLCLSQIDALRQNLPQTSEKAILRWIDFRQMTWRYDEVPLAYQETFRWIFAKPSADDSWDDFASHLASKNVTTPYFVKGKAGSGKSTLMKYIVRSSQTYEALSKWAGSEELLVVNFFFWYLGTPLQKSSVGMLRALLYAVLQRHPELIPAVFPTIYRNWNDTYHNSEPEYVEVKRAFELMTEKSSTFLRLCILVDGIDEFKGNHRDISEFLHSLASEEVKVVLSSRPINPCLHAFHGCPSLSLQDLTKHDMEIYVKGNLDSHPLMARLAARFPEEAAKLVTDIKTKAEGVFLWVTLVVRLLISGMEAGDDISDLQRKLCSLPGDLKDLYWRMMDKMQPEYQTQAAEMFQLFHRWNCRIKDQPLRTLIMAFAVKPFSEAFRRPVEPLDHVTLDWERRTIEARIRSRCCGLLEVSRRMTTVPFHWTTVRNTTQLTGLETVGVGSNTQGHFCFDLAVSYLHRTVAEFLLTKDVWKGICSRTANTAFDPDRQLASASLSMAKMARGFQDTLLPLHLHCIMNFCRGAVNLPDQTLAEFVNEIDRTMKHHQHSLSESESLLGHWTGPLYKVRFKFPPTSVDEMFVLGNVPAGDPIMNFAARTGCVQYLKSFGTKNLSAIGYGLVMYALSSWQYETYVSLHDRVETLIFLLQNAARADDSRQEGSLWDYAIEASESTASGSSLESAVLLAIFFLLSASPIKLMATGSKSLNVLEKIRTFKQRPDPDVQTLGRELELLSVGTPSPNIAEVLSNAVSMASGADSKSELKSNLTTERRRMAQQSWDSDVLTPTSTQLSTPSPDMASVAMGRLFPEARNSPNRINTNMIQTQIGTYLSPNGTASWTFHPPQLEYNITTRGMGPRYTTAPACPASHFSVCPHPAEYRTSPSGLAPSPQPLGRFINNPPIQTAGRFGWTRSPVVPIKTPDQPYFGTQLGQPIPRSWGAGWGNGNVRPAQVPGFYNTR